MPEFCTCGVELPPDARFCHKCGKPQREELPEPASEPEQKLEAPMPAFARPAVAGPAFTAPPTPGFHNPVAVRAALTAAALAALLNLVPILNLGFFIWLVAAGFFSVHLYQRRMGATLSVRQGARMGWITGVLSFAISTVFFTLTMVTLSTRAGGLQALYRKQMESMSMPEQSMREAVDLLQSPAGITFIVIGSLIFIFVMITILCTAGGALGAKILDKS